MISEVTIVHQVSSAGVVYETADMSVHPNREDKLIRSVIFKSSLTGRLSRNTNVRRAKHVKLPYNARRSISPDGPYSRVLSTAGGIERV